MSATVAFPSRLSSIGPALDWARARVEAWVPEDVIELGLVEAVTNAIVHGTDTSLSDITHRFELAIRCDEERLAIEVRWFGRSCPAARRAPTLPDDPCASHGRGLAILADSFHRVVWSPDGMAIRLELGSRPSRIGDSAALWPCEGT
ncbi:MAG: ATP-binding protein [Polyangiaceae bacterium]|nr:ATP-binding protein [Polyangiaceae bacterium]